MQIIFLNFIVEWEKSAQVFGTCLFLFA